MRTVPRHFQRALKRIDPDLEARWVPNAERWGIYHCLPFHERLEAGIEARALELQHDLLKRGYIATKQVCTEMSWLQTQERHLVFYVTEDNGAYRELDDRTLQKLQRMDYFRRNWGLKDWKEYMARKARLSQDMRERAMDDFINQTRRDRVYNQHAADALRGDRPVRSIYVEQDGKASRMPIADRGDEAEGKGEACSS